MAPAASSTDTTSLRPILFIMFDCVRDKGACSFSRSLPKPAKKQKVTPGLLTEGRMAAKNARPQAAAHGRGEADAETCARQAPHALRTRRTHYSLGSLHKWCDALLKHDHVKWVRRNGAQPDMNIVVSAVALVDTGVSLPKAERTKQNDTHTAWQACVPRAPAYSVLSGWGRARRQQDLHDLDMPFPVSSMSTPPPLSFRGAAAAQRQQALCRPECTTPQVRPCAWHVHGGLGGGFGEPIHVLVAVVCARACHLPMKVDVLEGPNIPAQPNRSGPSASSRSERAVAATAAIAVFATGWQRLGSMLKR